MEKQHGGAGLLLSAFTNILVLLVVVILSMELPILTHSRKMTNTFNTKSAVFLSPGFELEPGSVSNKFYYNIDFPRGHIAIKSFDAEVVDESGNSIPLHETYLHHWFVMRYQVHQDVADLEHLQPIRGNHSNFMYIRTGGNCEGDILKQYFGLGSETRRTQTYIPDPYGIEVGNPAEIPNGFMERWMMNVHAIDTRGTVDRLGCTECRCDLYNVTEDEFGRAIPREYVGGLNCCYDKARCRVSQGLVGGANYKRRLYLRYTMTWLDWSSDYVLPVKIYILDVADDWKASEDGTIQHKCKIEYAVEQSCSGDGNDKHNCVDTKWNSVKFPTGGHVVYAGAHLHTAGIGSTLYGQDGRVICSSNPIYGNGSEAGNEKGYVVGMTTCYPEAGTVKIGDGERVRMKFNYNSSTRHTGVMGLYYIIVAEQLPNPNRHDHHSLV